MQDKKTSLLFKIVKALVRFFYFKYDVSGAENIPDEPCVIVGNHTQLHSPLACEFYTPRPHYIWCAGQMMNWNECADYAFTDFWSYKPGWQQPFFRLCAHLIVPLCVLIFNGAHTIAVYHDLRVRDTFKESTEKLTEGYNIVIFPEKFELYNNVIYDFQDGFVDIARFYQRKTGKALKFVPMYSAPKLKTLYYGKPVEFDLSANPSAERTRIKQYLMDEITAMAASLPEHTVIPYRNIKKKDYPKNVPVRDMRK